MPIVSSNKHLNQISLTFKSQDVRTYADEKGELWFLANDVCAILGYANPRRTVSLHCKERGVSKRYTPTNVGRQFRFRNIEKSLLN